MGEAVQQQAGISWVFTATQRNASLSGDRITIRAYDRPGNETLEEKQV